ncbi:MAG TPA: hemolysin family protein [Acidimicrobiales bacterium]|jgi:CBS domain containing-hemolysin-like protein|nr:hemolysin family protein [Acidimicrobiales bacterium]
MIAAAASSTGHWDSSDLWILVAVGVLIILSGVLALAETGLTRMNRVKAMAMVEEQKRGAASLLKLVEHPERTLNPVLFLLLLCNTVAATLVGVVASRLFGAFGVAIATAFEVIVIFVFAEAMPKTWAVQHSERAALLASPVVSALVKIPPIRWISNGLIALANLILPGKGIKQGPYVSEQELLAMADAAASQDVIEREERRLIHSIIDFGDTVVREVMVPRPDMVVVESTAKVADVIEIAIAAGFSRIPVYGQGIDDILGVVFSKDLMKAEREGHGDQQVSEIMRQAHFVPETKRVSEMMREMQASKLHQAIVVDEYGGTAGLVTLEDLLEELVGEIEDEYDVEEAPVERINDGEVRVNARMGIDDLNELLGIELPEGDWDTVGGLVYGLLGHVPNEGESVVSNGHRLTAERVQGRRIGRVRITTVPPEELAVEAEAERDSARS